MKQMLVNSGAILMVKIQSWSLQMQWQAFFRVPKFKIPQAQSLLTSTHGCAMWKALCIFLSTVYSMLWTYLKFFICHDDN